MNKKNKTINISNLFNYDYDLTIILSYNTIISIEDNREHFIKR